MILGTFVAVLHYFHWHANTDIHMMGFKNEIKSSPSSNRNQFNTNIILVAVLVGPGQLIIFLDSILWFYNMVAVL